MNLANFTEHLNRNPDHGLSFEFGSTTIGRGYHLTEVLRLSVDAIDCGGALDHWSETVLQLVDSPPAKGQTFMSAGKALQILQRSQASLPLVQDSELVLEFHPAGAPAAQRYHVVAVEPGEDRRLRVRTRGTRTQCKAMERSPGACGVKGSAGPVSACCTPAAEPTVTSTQQREARSCCA